MRKLVLFLVTIFLFILFFSLIVKLIVYYPEMTIQLQTSEGIPIKGVDVHVKYLCTSYLRDVGGGHSVIHFGERRIFSDSKGIAHFKSLSLFFKFFPLSHCDRYIMVGIDSPCQESEDYSSTHYGPTSFFVGKNEKRRTITLFETAFVPSEIDLKYPLKCKYAAVLRGIENLFERKAIATKNTSLCMTKEGYYSFVECISTIAREVKDITLCDLLDYPLSPEVLSKIGMQGQNYGSRDDKITCINYLAVDLGNPNLCTQIATDHTKILPFCQFNAIKNSGDASLCSTLNSEYRLNCKIYFSQFS